MEFCEFGCKTFLLRCEDTTKPHQAATIKGPTLYALSSATTLVSWWDWISLNSSEQSLPSTAKIATTVLIEAELQPGWFCRCGVILYTMPST